MRFLTSLDVRRVARLLGEPVTTAVPVRRGYTSAARWRVSLARSGHAFVKVGATTYTADALRLERRAYDSLTGPFMPAVLAWEDHPEAPMLILEDLTDAQWPPPWTSGTVEAVLGALAALRPQGAALAPIGLTHPDLDNGWTAVADNPEPFLSLDLTSPEWLARHLGTLVAAGDAARLDGQDAMHLDVRSDNLCFTPRGAILVDWNGACRGNGLVDIAFWLPSLRAEGGPRPQAVLRGEPELAAFVSGFFAARAGLPLIADAPRVRAVQRRQLEPALLWAADALGIEAPVGRPTSRSSSSPQAR